MKKAFLLCLIIITLLLGYSVVFAEPEIIDIANNKTITFSEMINDLQGITYIFLGDDITVKEHQVAQSEIIDSIYKKNNKLAIGLEVFRSSNQYVLDAWVFGGLEKRSFVDKFNSNWGDWNRYSKIFQYARDKKIQLAALNVSRDILIQVEMQGFDSLSESQLGSLGEGIVCDLVPSYTDVMRRMHLYKGTFKRLSFENYCEMQILGDIMMAKNLKEFNKEHHDLTVIVIAGETHSWKHGVPERIGTDSKIQSKTILFEGRINRNNATSAEADYLWLNSGDTGWREN